MAHVTFHSDFDYRVSRGVTIAYKAGWSGSVKRDCCRKAVAAGKAVELPKPPRPGKAADDA
ncbi:Hypothetical protein NGAL_HAMBI1146_59630 [Neorhizobium galegae bv. officinalis]|nr:Hypothetical protein NGAL_HAMBI1146_59630 [Neorhizobium galegae bv. officinalis]